MDWHSKGGWGEDGEEGGRSPGQGVIPIFSASYNPLTVSLGDPGELVATEKQPDAYEFFNRQRQMHSYHLCAGRK